MNSSTDPEKIEPSSFGSRMLDCLKRIFRAQGLKYTDVATLLGVNEKSVKRYMNGRGLSVVVLEKLCAAGGLTLPELSMLASADKAQPAWTTNTQEDALAADPPMAIVFGLLSSGWNVANLIADGLCDETRLIGILAQLDRLGVISLYPGNRFILRARVRRQDECSERLRKVMVAAGARVVQSAAFASPDTPWQLNYARLGPASLTRAMKRMQDLLDDVVELSRQDMELRGDQMKWYAFCTLIRQHEPLGLTLMNSEPDQATARRSTSRVR